jgi:hypothetical protein
MSRQNRLQLLGILALCAIACYTVGLIAGAVLFIAIGAIFELSFWFGVFRKFQKLK